MDTCKSRIVDIQTKPQIRDSSHEAELKSSSSSVINRGKEKISWKDVAGLELAKKMYISVICWISDINEAFTKHSYFLYNVHTYLMV